ncbi:MAG: preprotein translocase subunit SecA, partial [Bifidobacterium longum]|nr:preprotein translocase subunit SecA [Bifidobacterium longum]
MVDIIDKALRMGEGHQLKKLENVAKAVNALEDEISALSDEDLKAQTPKFKQEIENGKSLDEIMPEAFATVREVSKRTLGQRHFDVQLMGGAALHWGNIAEMKTGEGKTLVATLPTYLNALEGKGVHVVTVNDYLASYQSELMGRIYRFLGMNVGCIITEQKPPERRKQYNADITYGTNNEFGFDYLRDNMAWEKADLVQRGHHYAIVDEVDSILIDEARTPLIISGPAEGDVTRWYRQFAKLVLKLTRDEDYDVDEKKKVVGILDPGITKVEDFLGIDNLYEPANTALIGYLNNAIKAKELFLRDKDYVVTQGEVLIVDEHTGRILPGRRYNEGLHQAIEAKEGVEVKAENQTFATITLQNYFRMYDKLAGMTGTAETEAAEFMNTYKLGVLPIKTNKPMIRKDQDDLIYRTKKEKLAAIVKDVAKRHAKGQPVLLGTASVESSEVVSTLLDVAKIPHQVLNAKQHEKEAAVVAVAGRKGAVTVATNMAGRGTDIMLGGNVEFLADAKLKSEGYSPEDTPEEYEKRWPGTLNEIKAQVKDEHEEVKELGGLYVLGTERHESRRIDNQLRGRSGRQGDPGESRFYLSLEDDLMRLFNTQLVAQVMAKGMEEGQPIEAKSVTKGVRTAQKAVESRNYEIRKNVLKYDDVMNKQRTVIYSER